MSKHKIKDINVEEYICFTRDGNAGAINILQPVIYSNSNIFNTFDYQQKFLGLEYLSLKIDNGLIFDSFLYILLEELKAYCKLNNIKLLVVSDNDDFDAY
jgi:hypothetical protein